MRCKNCNKELKEDEVFCQNCGCKSGKKVTNIDKNARELDDEEYDFAEKLVWGILGFFFPLIGLILFLVWKPTKPRQAKAVGIGALVKVILASIIFIILISYSYYNLHS